MAKVSQSGNRLSQELKLLKPGSYDYGMRSVLRGVYSGSIHRIIVSDRLQLTQRRLLEHIALALDTKVDTFTGDARQLGTVLGKTHGIAVVGLTTK